MVAIVLENFSAAKDLNDEQKRRKAGKQALPPESIELKWVFHACAAEVVDNISTPPLLSNSRAARA